MNILSGKEVASKIKTKLKNKVSKLSFVPSLAVLQIGDDKDSNKYIEKKIQFGEEIGVKVLHKKFPKNINQENFIKEITKLNKDKKIQGIIVQLPIPKNFDLNLILNSIDPEKDVDGLSKENIYSLLIGDKKGFVPATALAVIEILDFYKITIKSQNVVVVGQSLLAGKSISMSLLDRGATVTACHKDTKDLKNFTKTADILITAVGKPGLITDSFIGKNQTIIDVGATVRNGKVIGDVDLKKASSKNGPKNLTPVPGGVGPVTVACLFANLLKSVI